MKAFWSIAVLPRVKEALRSLIGDDRFAEIHSRRFVRNLTRNPIVEPDLAVLDLVLQPGDSAIDVGANGGDWALSLARAVGESGRVFSFEADPYYALVTKKVVRNLGLTQVEVFDFGLSSFDGEGFLRIRTDQGLRMSGLGSVVPRSTPDTVSVGLRRLDSLPQCAEVQLLKIDVEGHELEVLRGAATVLEYSPIVIAEVEHIGKANTSAEIAGFLADLGYRQFILDSVTKKLVAQPEYESVPGSPNRWFLREPQITALRTRGML